MESPHQEREVQRLFIENAAVIRGFILALVPDRHQAKDIFQEVFLTISCKAGQFELGTGFLPWARQIVRFKVLEHYRSEKRTDPSRLALRPEVIETLEQSATALDETWQRRRRVLDECLQQVPKTARRTLDLRYVEGLAPTEIAGRLYRSVSSVNVLLSRTRRMLRDCVRRHSLNAEGEA